MVIDQINRKSIYDPLNRGMKVGFDFLEGAAELAPGRYELGYGIYAMVSEGETQPLAETPLLEAHRRYIDLQYVVSGSERMAWASLNSLTPADTDEAHDCDHYTGAYTEAVAEAGTFYIMFPGDGHMATFHRTTPRRYKKVVVKIPVE